MKIVKCSKCNKYIHKSNKCFFCGNTIGFDAIEMLPVHENVVVEYSKIESLIEKRQFSEAMVLSHKVIEWMPNFAGIFWLRVLIKNKCMTAEELIKSGFSCKEDSDFYNALSFSSGEERSAYLNIQNAVIAAQKAIKDEVYKHEYNCKINTGILDLKKTMQGEIETEKEKLFSLWSNLVQIEQELYDLEMDCCLLSNEHRNMLNKAEEASATIKKEIYQLEECTAENLYKYQIKIGNILQQSEQAKDALVSIGKQHPWIKEFNDLVVKRDGQIKLIGTELVSLKNYIHAVQQTLIEIGKIEEQHKKILSEVENYKFQEAAILLGKDIFNQIFQNITFEENV